MDNKKVVDFRQRNLIFVDLETTGLDPEQHEIIEIACLVVDGETFVVKKQYEEKIKPIHLETANPNSLQVNGYSDEEWREAKSLFDVLKEVNQLTPGGILVGWNVSFDWGFLERGFKYLGMLPQFDYHRIDVMSIAYAKVYSQKEIRELGMRKIAPHLGINLQERKPHRAAEDVQACFEIFKKLMER